MENKKNASEKIIYDFEQLFNISQNLNSILDFSNLLDSLIGICLTHALVKEAGLFLQTNDDSFLLQRNHKLDLPRHEYKFSLSGCHEFIEFLEKNKKSFYCKDLKEDQLPAILNLLEITAVTPLFHKNELVGLFVYKSPLDEKQFYDPYTLEFLDRLGSISAVALKNAQLYEMATTDKMTSLLQNHIFMEIVEKYIKSHEDQEMSIIILDIDSFRTVNDNFGHSAGDEVLIEIASRIKSGTQEASGLTDDHLIREVAFLLKKSMRNFDLIGRMGGEEFVIFLPEAVLDNAVKVAERIRKNLATVPVKSSSLKKEITVTASFGVSQYNKAEPLHYLLDRCNKALSLSKENGRNQVTSL